MRPIPTLPLAVLFACVMAFSTQAASKDDFLSKFKWVHGPAKGDLKSIGEIKVPPGFMLTDEKGTQALLEAMGNPIGGNELGFLAPTSMVWFVVFEFSDVGYVKDDDKDKLDAEALLKAIKAGNERANEERKKMGVSPLNITGWEQPPKYNPETHNLEWAIRAESEGKPVLNYNTRLLGRKGVMEVALVVEPEQLKETMPAYQAILKDYAFKTGEKYAEYKSGDKLAQFGLAALVTGGAAAVAAKLGFFAWLALFFKKAWKLVIIGVVAIGAFFKRIITGRSASE
jgi:uncharacterized membrane-anchored protein